MRMESADPGAATSFRLLISSLTDHRVAAGM
jgi:hypothetical protein